MCIRDSNKLDINVLQKEEVAAHLTLETIKNLKGNSKYSANDIKAVEVARDKGIKEAVASGSQYVQKALVKNWGKDEIEKLSIDTLTDENAVKYLTSEKINMLPTEALIREKMKDHWNPKTVEGLLKKDDFSDVEGKFKKELQKLSLIHISEPTRPY